MMAVRRESAAWVLHILGLWAITVAHPLLDLLAKSPEFFVAHRASTLDILLLLFTLIALLPVPLVAFVAASGVLGARARTVTLAAVIALLAMVLSLQVANKAGVATWTIAIPLAAASGLALSFAYSRLASVRTFASVLSIAVVLVPVVFVARPGIRALLAPRNVRSTAANVQPVRPVPVVMIVFDELPLTALMDVDGNIEEAHYPNLAKLARDGVWYRNATTVHEATRWALPAIVTGRYPPPESIPTPSFYPDSLFTLLANSHRLEVDEPQSALCPAELCRDTAAPQRRLARWRGLAADLAVIFLHLTLPADQRGRLPDLTAAWAGFGGAGTTTNDAPDEWRKRRRERENDDRRQVMLRFIDRIDSSSRQPRLYFMHSMLSHHFYTFLPSGQQNLTRMSVPHPSLDGGIDDPWALLQQQQRQMLHIGYIDTIAGRLIQRLLEAGLYDRSLIVLTSDHGSAYRPRSPFRIFSKGAASDIMRVPLIIKFPSDSPPAASGGRVPRGIVTDVNAETIDIVPTIADALGTRVPWPADGRSLIDPAALARTQKRISTGSKKTYWYGAEGPPLKALLQEKQQVFDGATNRYRVPRPTRFAALVGRPVESLRVIAGEELTEVHDLWTYLRFDPAADAVPMDVSGRLLKRPAGNAPVYIAVAVNGVVEAITQTWKTRPTEWVATPPLDVWRRGRNAVDVFLVEESAGQPVLRRAFRPRPRPAGLNLVARTAGEFGVYQSGLYREESSGGRMFRWTSGKVEIAVPLEGRHPRALRIDVARSSRPHHRFRISAGDCVLFDGRVPTPDWETTFDLGRCRLAGDTLDIELESDVVRPPRDSRQLGVALRSIVLDDAPAARR
jgi:arylsulfatase A-like enzyme